MMKKILILLSVLLILCGCTPKKKPSEPVHGCDLIDDCGDDYHDTEHLDFKQAYESLNGKMNSSCNHISEIDYMKFMKVSSSSAQLSSSSSEKQSSSSKVQSSSSSVKQSSSSEWSVLIPESQVQVSRFFADLVYIFRQDALRMITYEFTKDCSMLNYQYLTGALCSLYGENREADAAVIKGWMDRIFPNHYALEQIHEAREWTTEDGTSIFQYYYTAENYAILYICPTTNGGNAGYDTNGL